MGLSADDIVNYPLKQAVRGYSVPQVDELLDQVADTVERMASELDDLRHRLRLSEERLAATSETESTLKRTLVTAQRAAEQSIEEAREQADGLVEDARREAATIVEQARLEAEELRVEALKAARAEEAEIRRRRRSLEGHIEALRIFEREYRTRLREHLEEQLRLVDAVGHREEDVPQLDVDADDADVAPLTVRVRAEADGEVTRDEPADDAEGDDTHPTSAVVGVEGEREVGSRAPGASDAAEVRAQRGRSVP